MICGLPAAIVTVEGSVACITILAVGVGPTRIVAVGGEGVFNTPGAAVSLGALRKNTTVINPRTAKGIIRRFIVQPSYNNTERL